MTETKRGPGRPPKGPARHIKLPADWWDWLKAQNRDYSDTILDALKEYRERHQ